MQPTEPEEGTRAANRNALGWYDDAMVYIPAHRIVEAAGGILKETAIGRALDAQGLIAKRKDTDCNFHSSLRTRPKPSLLSAGRSSRTPRYGATADRRPDLEGAEVAAVRNSPSIHLCD